MKDKIIEKVEEGKHKIKESIEYGKEVLFDSNSSLTEKLIDPEVAIQKSNEDELQSKQEKPQDSEDIFEDAEAKDPSSKDHTELEEEKHAELN